MEFKSWTEYITDPMHLYSKQKARGGISYFTSQSRYTYITEGASSQFLIWIFNFRPYEQLRAVREKIQSLMVLSFEPTHCKGIQLCIHLKTPKGLFRYFYLLIDFQSLKLNSTEFGPGILFLVCFGNHFTEKRKTAFGGFLIWL